MNCRGFRKYVGAFADGELDTDRNLEALEHLNFCEQCAVKVARIQKLKEALARSFEQESAPEGLADRIHAAIAGEPAVEPVREASRRATGQRPPRIHRWVVPVGMAAAVVFVWQASLWFGGPAAIPSGGPRNAVEARFVSATRTRHRDCTRLGAAHHRKGLPLKIGPLREALSKELSLPVLVPDLTRFGYQLQSADTCGVGKTPGAHVVYVRPGDGRTISVFTLERRGSFEPTDGLLIAHRACFVSEGSGPTVLAWHDGPATYVLCGAVPVERFRAIVESLR